MSPPGIPVLTSLLPLEGPAVWLDLLTVTVPMES